MDRDRFKHFWGPTLHYFGLTHPQSHSLVVLTAAGTNVDVPRLGLLLLQMKKLSNQVWIIYNLDFPLDHEVFEPSKKFCSRLRAKSRDAVNDSELLEMLLDSIAVILVADCCVYSIGFQNVFDFS